MSRNTRHTLAKIVAGWESFAVGLCLILGLSNSVNAQDTKPKYSVTDFFSESKVAELAEAGRNGDLATIDRLVKENKVDVNSRGREGLTPLIYALSGKSLAGFLRLLEHGGDPNLQTDRGWSAVGLAAERKDPEALKLVLSHGGNPNLRVECPKSTPLIEYSVLDPTPLYNSIHGRSPRSARLLIKAGADLNASDSDTRKRTPLMLAALDMSFDVMHVLLEAGADFRAADIKGYSVAHYLIESTVNDEASELGRSRQKCVDFLIHHGVDFEKEKVSLAEVKRREQESVKAEEKRLRGEVVK